MHVIGSYPASTPEEAMRDLLTVAAPHLAYLPDGETGARKDWVVGMINGLRSHPDLAVRKEGDWSDYAHQLNFKVRRGHRLRGETVDFGVADAQAGAWPAFERLRAEFGRPDLPFQVGIPGDLDLAMFALGPTGPLSHRRPFRESMLRDIARIHAVAGSDVVFQIEVPAEQAFVAMAPGPLRKAVATLVGAGIARLARDAPPGARFGIHLCLGDLGHKALTSPRDASPIVALANAIARGWPAGRPLDYLHAPLAAGDQPPVLESRFYAPLSGLRLPVGTRFVAGILHERRTVAELRALTAAIDVAVGHPVDVAASCGYGRRSKADAQTTLQQGVALCET